MIEVWTRHLESPPCASCQRKLKRQPEGYIDWHMWAERKSRTHHQVQCATCGYFVWVKKPKEEK